MRALALLALLPLLAEAACSSKDGPPPDPCEGAPNCVGFPAGTPEATIQKAFVTAKEGTTFRFAAGTFSFTNQLSLAANGVTVRGAGIDQTVLDFKGQTAGSEGLFVTGNGFSTDAFSLKDPKGDGIKVEGATTVRLRNVKVYWSGGSLKSNGAYGLYPVQCKDVLIEGAIVSGASDAGIYVGQSENIIVRKSRAELNVAGIEIENSYGADVYDNDATKNAGGILIFDLPGLPKQGGHGVRVFKNRVKEDRKSVV